MIRVGWTVAEKDDSVSFAVANVDGEDTGRPLWRGAYLSDLVRAVAPAIADNAEGTEGASFRDPERKKYWTRPKRKVGYPAQRSPTGKGGDEGAVLSGGERGKGGLGEVDDPAKGSISVSEDLKGALERVARVQGISMAEAKKLHVLGDLRKSPTTLPPTANPGMRWHSRRNPKGWCHKSVKQSLISTSSFLCHLGVKQVYVDGSTPSKPSPTPPGMVDTHDPTRNMFQSNVQSRKILKAPHLSCLIPALTLCYLP